MPVALLLACSTLEPLDAPSAPAVRVSQPTTVRLVAVGDTGLGNRAQHQVARAMGSVCAQRGCDLALLLGDNLYPRGMQAPDDPRMDEVLTDVYADLGLPIYGVLGNHDWGHGRDRQAAEWQVQWAQGSDLLVMPERYYRFSAGPVDFFALDTNPIFWRSDPVQERWFAQALADSQAPFKVAFGHHPYRSEGKHGNAGSYERLGWVPIVGGAALQRLFDDHVCSDLDLYVSGHDHNLQWIRHCDTDLVVSGAGASTRPLVGTGNAPLFAADRLGFAWIALTLEEDGERRLELAFYDEEAQLLHEGARRLPPTARAETDRN